MADTDDVMARMSMGARERQPLPHEIPASPGHAVASARRARDPAAHPGAHRGRVSLVYQAYYPAHDAAAS